MCQGITFAQGYGEEWAWILHLHIITKTIGHIFVQCASPAPRCLLLHNPATPCTGMYSLNAQDTFSHHKYTFYPSTNPLLMPHCHKACVSSAFKHASHIAHKGVRLKILGFEHHHITQLPCIQQHWLHVLYMHVFSPKHTFFSLPSTLHTNRLLKEAHLCQHIWHQTLWPLLTDFNPFASLTREQLQQNNVPVT